MLMVSGKLVKYVKYERVDNQQPSFYSEEGSETRWLWAVYLNGLRYSPVPPERVL